jgi:hypothetical protein
MKPRKPLRVGSAWKETQRTAKIRKQKEDERQRHQSAMNDLSLRRQKALLQADSARRTIELSRIVNKQVAENYRHRSKMETLNSRLFNKT